MAAFDHVEPWGDPPENVTVVSVGDGPDVAPDEWVREHGTAVRFRVHDLASAEWAVRKLARARARIAEAERYVADEVDKLKGWLAGEALEAERAEEYFGGLLRQWHCEVLADEPRRKTIKLPSGELRARKAPDRVEVEDDDAFVCAVGLDSPLVVVRARPDKAAIKAHIATTGEALPGVDVVVGEVRYTVDTGGDS